MHADVGRGYPDNDSHGALCWMIDEGEKRLKFGKPIVEIISRSHRRLAAFTITGGPAAVALSAT